MYKISIILSMLCMPLVSFGMGSGYFSHVDALSDLDKIENNSNASYFNHVGLLEPQKEAQSSSDTVQEESSSQESEPAQNASMPLPYFFVDSGLLNEAPSQQETQSIPYNAALQPMQEFDTALERVVSQPVHTDFGERLSDSDIRAAVESLFTCNEVLDDYGLLACDEILDEEVDEEGKQSSVLYNDYMLQHMQARYDAINNTQGLHDADLQAAVLRLFANDNSSVLSQSGAVNTQWLHFPDLQSTQISEQSCDKPFEEVQPIPQSQVVQRVQRTVPVLKKIQKKSADSRKKCPDKSCRISLSLKSDMENHAAAMHHMCLLCKPLLRCGDAKSIQQHFQQKHPSSRYAIRNRKIACEQCGKEVTAVSMNWHLKMHARKNMQSNTSTVMRDKN